MCSNNPNNCKSDQAATKVNSLGKGPKHLLNLLIDEKERKISFDERRHPHSQIRIFEESRGKYGC
jgi:hypothetical protein